MCCLDVKGGEISSAENAIIKGFLDIACFLSVTLPKKLMSETLILLFEEIYQQPR